MKARKKSYILRTAALLSYFAADDNHTSKFRLVSSLVQTFTTTFVADLMAYQLLRTGRWQSEPFASRL